MRFVPPAGAPLQLRQILNSLRVAISSNGHARESLEAIAARLRVKCILATGSGRAALYLILKSLHRLHPDRDVVVLPAYTCFSVPAAIVRAGLKMYPIDVNPDTLDFDSNQLSAVPERELLCIIACNLFGFPNEMLSARNAARAKGAYLIDDAAQALGSTRDGQLAGTLGDVGVYSLGRGKAVGTVGGGLIVTNSGEINMAIQTEEQNLAPSDSMHGPRLLLEMFSYSLLVDPRLFWIPNSLPFLKLGTTEFDPSFPIGKMHSLSLELLQQLFEGLDEINEIRRRNAKAITDALWSNRKLAFPRPAGNSQATFVRLPVMADDGAIRHRAVVCLRKAGIGASAFYPSAICDIPEIENHMSDRNFHRPHAEDLSRRLFTLPVHPFVNAHDIERMVEILTTL